MQIVLSDIWTILDSDRKHSETANLENYSEIIKTNFGTLRVAFIDNKKQKWHWAQFTFPPFI